MDDGKMAVVGLDGATLQDAPGGKTVAELSAGDVVMAVGRTEDGKYLQVEADRGQKGWVATSSVVVFGIDVLPVVEPPAPPTPTKAPTPTPVPPTPTPTAMPTTGRRCDRGAGSDRSGDRGRNACRDCDDGCWKFR